MPANVFRSPDVCGKNRLEKEAPKPQSRAPEKVYTTEYQTLMSGNRHEDAMTEGLFPPRVLTGDDYGALVRLCSAENIMYHTQRGTTCNRCGHTFRRDFTKHQKTVRCSRAEPLTDGDAPSDPFFADITTTGILPPSTFRTHKPEVRAIVLRLILMGYRVSYRWLDIGTVVTRLYETSQC